MTCLILMKESIWALDAVTVEELIEKLQSFPSNAKINIESQYDDYEFSIYMEETKEQKQARLLKEKEEKEAAKRQKEFKRYLELKAKFE